MAMTRHQATRLQQVFLVMMSAVIVIGLLSSMESASWPSSMRSASSPLPALSPSLDDLELTALNIFFIETDSSVRKFRARVHCAFESAALHNPDHRVFVLMNNEKNETELEPTSYLRSLPNLHFRTLNFSSLVRGTELEALWRSGRVHDSKYALNNISNIMRLLLLYHYGGVYLDTDVISLQHLPREKDNFAIFQQKGYVNNAILAFKTPRHKLIQKAIQLLASDFKGDAWGHQGPSLVTRAAKTLCPWTPKPNSTMLVQCKESLVILPSEAGYAIPYRDWRHFFSPESVLTVTSGLARSFATHYWNHMRVANPKEEFVWREEMPLANIMARSCPRTESEEIRHLYGLKFT